MYAHEIMAGDFPGHEFGMPEAALAAASIQGQSLSVYKFVTQFGIGGTEMQVLGLARKFDPRRFSLAFGCLERQGSLEPEYDDRGWSISEYPIDRFASITAGRQMLRLARELRMRNPEIMHSYNFYANVFSLPAARLAQVPCVIASIRDMGAYMTPMQQRVQRWACRLADRVVVNADAIRIWLIEEGYDPGKIRVIRNGANMPERDSGGARRKIRSEFGIPQNAKVVIMVSRLNAKKGVEYLLDAAAQILREVPDAWFMVVGISVLETSSGGTDYFEGLKLRTRHLGIHERFIFTGLRRDVPDLLAAADVSVLPSLSEGLPNAVIEAMAAGLPVVGTKVGGIPELIDHGRTGLLIPPADVGALSESLTAVLDNPHLSKRLGEAARTRIQTEFSFERMVRETEALYRDVLAEEKNHRRLRRDGGWQI